MNILFATAHPTLPEMKGGMQSSVNELASQLARRGHKVSVLCGLEGSGWLGKRARAITRLLRRPAARDRVMGYPVWRGWFPWESMAWCVGRIKPDVVVIPAGQPVRMARAARALGVPVLMSLQDVHFEGHGGAFDHLGAVPCVANSRFTAERYGKAFGVAPSVIHPLINAEKYRTATTRGNVTFINPHVIKGMELAAAVARQCPDIPFLFVEAWYQTPHDKAALMEKIGDLPNVTLRPPVRDMKEVYGACRILLVPSLCEEGYGRVVSEAQFSGIPAIASNSGGLPEAVGAGGILLNPQGPVDDWVAAVRGLWADQGRYDALSAAARAHAARPALTLDDQLDMWEESLAEAIKAEQGV